MSAVQVCFQWVRENTDAPLATGWPSVLREIRLVRGFLPFLRVGVSRPLLPLFVPQDAAGGGDGAGPAGSFVLAVGLPSLELIEQVWAGRDVRGAVVGTLSDEGVDGPTASGALGVVQRLASANQDSTAEWIPFTGLPTAAVCQAPWFRLLAGLWHSLDHINSGEGRSTQMWLE